ncbi:MAG: RDD family protein [Verrucomicrobia bacterium]|nr:RDD family protein [Verrucomicrobiota bacterium]
MNLWIFNSKNPSKSFRALARFVDYLLLFLVGGSISMFFPWFIDTLYYLAFALAVPFLWIPIEALLVSLTATTPGKALFGIKIFERTGRKLSYWESFKAACFFGPKNIAIRQMALSFKRRITALIIIAGCAIASIFGNALTKWSIGLEKGISTEGWVQYAHEDAGFKVHFPNDPQQESKLLPIPEANKVLNYEEIKTHQNKEVFYSVTYMDLPRKWKMAGSTTLLKGALDIMVKYMPGTTIIEKKFSTHQTHRSLDFRLQQGDQHVKGRLILDGTTLYKLTITYPPSLEAELQDNPFLDSFDLSAAQ